MVFNSHLSATAETVSPSNDPFVDEANDGEVAASEGKEVKQRKCFPRMKKKQDRYFQIIAGFGAIVFGTLILGIPSYVILSTALKSGMDSKGEWKGFPEKLTGKEKFYRHTKAQAMQFGCVISAVSGIFVLVGVVSISFNACCVKNLPESVAKPTTEEDYHNFKLWHRQSSDMELKKRSRSDAEVS